MDQRVLANGSWQGCRSHISLGTNTFLRTTTTHCAACSLHYTNGLRRLHNTTQESATNVPNFIIPRSCDLLARNINVNTAWTCICVCQRSYFYRIFCIQTWPTRNFKNAPAGRLEVATPPPRQNLLTIAALPWKIVAMPLDKQVDCESKISYFRYLSQTAP